MSENTRPTGDVDLVLALAEGASVPEAAERGGLSERTVYRRLEDVEFRRAVSEVRSRVFDAAVGRLAALAARAVSTLERLMLHGEPSVALRAAKTILEIGPRLRAFTELEERVAALEAEERKPRGNALRAPSGETESESGEADFSAKVRKGMGGTTARLNARLERLETQRAERNASQGRSVAEASEEGTATRQADGTDEPPPPCDPNSVAPSGALQDAGSEPPPQPKEVPENERKGEIRWR